MPKGSARGDGSGDGTRRRLRELVDEFSTQLDVLTCFHRANPDHECFVKHFYRQASEFFTLLRQANVEATNYRAEQAIRPSVVNREVWDGNPTDNGTHGQSILTSVLVTCDQLLRNPLEFLAQSLRATQTIPLLARGRGSITSQSQCFRSATAVAASPQVSVTQFVVLANDIGRD